MSDLPYAFVDRIRAQFPDDGEELLESLSRTSRTSIRINNRKPASPIHQDERVPWNTEGYRLADRPVFTLDPLFHAGCYYPQESSSMFLQWVLLQVVDLSPAMRVLDLCAAPGGKTLILSDYFGPSATVVANEINPARSRILQEVITKWGCTNTVVTCGQPSALGELTEAFDVLLVDAPCSGEGMFRKDHAARLEWNESSVEHCSVRQQEILDDVLPALRENGILLYSTCTFASEENERMLAALLETGEYESIRFDVPREWSVDVIDRSGVFACRFLPHRTEGEGFFIGALRKKSGSSGTAGKPKAVFKPCDAGVIQSAAKWCVEPQLLVTGPDQECYASPLDVKELNTLASVVYVLMPGVHLGKAVRNDFIPSHGLAMTDMVSSDVARVSLDINQAMAYLRGETISLSEHPVNGWCLAVYQGRSLGWMKVIGARINNYYPKEWRVRMR